MSRLWVADLVLAAGCPPILSAAASVISGLEAGSDIYSSPYYMVIPKEAALPLMVAFLIAVLWSWKAPENADRAQLIPIGVLLLYLVGILYLIRRLPEP